MYFFDWLAKLLGANGNLGVAMITIATLLIVALALGYVCKERNVYIAFCVLIGGGVCAALSALDMHADANRICLSLFFMVGGVNYLLLTAFFALRERVLRRRKQRAEIARRLLYTLPEKDNSYIRARLNTALNGEENETETRFLEEDEGQKALVRLEHVRKLLTKIKEAPLTKAERLESEEMTKLFAAYLGKRKWSSSDVRAVNELFSALLKLSAKYSV